MIHRVVQKLSTNKGFLVFLGLAAGVAGAISLSIGLQQSVWFDEAYSILLAKQPIAELLRLTALDTHPPLYYLALKGWAGLFGWSELSLRLESVCSMVLAIVVGGLLVRRMFGTKIALGGVLLLAMGPLVLRYGFEIRMYASAMLVGITATYALYSAWKAKGRGSVLWLVAYGVLVAAGTYLLYYLAFLWIAHVVWLIYVRYKHRLSWRAMLPFLAAYAGAVMLFLPWLKTFLSQISNGALAPIGQPLNLEQLLGIVTFNFLYQPLYTVNVAFTIVVIALVAVFVWAIPRARQELNSKSDEVSLLGVYIGVPIILLMIISLSRSMYTERYLSHVAIGLLLLAGIIIAAATLHAVRLRQPVAWVPGIVGTVALVGVVHLAMVGNFNFQRMQTPTVRQTAASLADCARRTKLLAADPYVATELTYYLPNCQLYFISEWDDLRGGYAPFSGSEYQVKHTNDLMDERITYVFYGTPDQAIPERYTEVSRRSYGPLNVAEYSLSAE